MCAADDKEAEERKEQRHEAVQEQDEIQAPLSSGLARATHRRDTLPPAEAEERAAPLWHCWHVFSSTALHVRDVRGIEELYFLTPVLQYRACLSSLFHVLTRGIPLLKYPLLIGLVRRLPRLYRTLPVRFFVHIQGGSHREGFHHLPVPRPTALSTALARASISLELSCDLFRTHPPCQIRSARLHRAELTFLCHILQGGVSM